MASFYNRRLIPYIYPVKIFSAKQIKEWDAYTIQHEPISSIDLMERAAAKCTDWIIANTNPGASFIIFCGPGNNGGDGLVIARMLIALQKKVLIYILQQTKYSPDFTINLERLQLVTDSIHTIINNEDFPAIASDAVVIDALFGYGLNRPLTGIAAELVQHINNSNSPVIAIDIPSGLFADSSSKGNPCIKATHTLTFQQLKLAFLMPENQDYMGKTVVLDINLHPDYYKETETPYEITSKQLLQSFFKPRKPFTHKGDFGNLALIAGSHGMMGAAVLAAKACLRSGAGKLTCYVPGDGYTILQTSVPEAMCVTDENAEHHTEVKLKTAYDALGVGPGMGSYHSNAQVIESLLQTNPAKLIADADGLNTIAAHPKLLQKLPANTIITPHPKEFERLFGSSANHFERLSLALKMAEQLKIIIVLKGKFTCIATPAGKAYFNPTGNAGMATGGTGDVLTGILLALSAQYPDSIQTAILAVYLHGLSGDIAAAEKTEEALIAGDIIEYLPGAFKTLKTV